MKVSVIFEKAEDFVAFYNQGLPRFYLELPFDLTPLLLDEAASKFNESEAEAKIVTVMDVAEEDLPAFESVIQSFRGRVVSSDELDTMGI